MCDLQRLSLSVGMPQFGERGFGARQIGEQKGPPVGVRAVPGALSPENDSHKPTSVHQLLMLSISAILVLFW